MVDVPQPEGIKHDAEKPQMELFSPIWLVGVATVLAFGGRKYAAHNWRKGLKLSRLLGACLRHVVAFLGGEDQDQETGLCHLDHASCCLMFARELWSTRPELDDRFKVYGPQPGKPDPIATEFAHYAKQATDRVFDQMEEKHRAFQKRSAEKTFSGEVGGGKDQAGGVRRVGEGDSPSESLAEAHRARQTDLDR